MKKVTIFAVFAAVALMSLSCNNKETDKKSNSRKCKTCGALEMVTLKEVA